MTMSIANGVYAAANSTGLTATVPSGIAAVWFHGGSDAGLTGNLFHFAAASVSAEPAETSSGTSR